MQGTRVGSLDEVMDGQSGSYFPMLDEGGNVISLWAKLPTGSMARLPNKGHGKDEAEWEITINEDGTVTVDPSIEQHEIPGNTPYWHGHLRNGIWEG